ncbi:hypothetical protein K9U39_17815 [Rhodoblastus acidophilus]|nr:hypothetical protein [Rhodoblastus acidophilus]
MSTTAPRLQGGARFRIARFAAAALRQQREFVVLQACKPRERMTLFGELLE